MNLLLLLSLMSINLQREESVRVHNVAHSGNFCFCYHLKAQLRDLRTVLECNLWRIEQYSASLIT
jgi:hypothetical protein